METIGRALTIGWVVVFLGGCAYLVATMAPADLTGWVVVGVVAMLWLLVSFVPFAIVASVLGAAMWGRDAVKRP